MSWIQKIVKSTQNVESPERYFWWSAIAGLSAAVGKNIWLDRGGHYNLYLNVFVCLVSSHSGLRKGLPVSIISKILEMAEVTRVVEGRNSIQSILKEFSQQVTMENGAVFSDAIGIMVSGEFDTFLIKDDEGLTILTALYNTHEHGKKWKNSLKGTGVESLKNPCISLLVASNETLFESAVKGKDIEGGFIARTFIVHESKARGINPLIEKDPNVIPIKELSDYLVDLSKVKGEFKWSEGAKILYTEWYTELRSFTYEDRTGTINRLGDSVLKVAMLIALSKRFDLILYEEDLQEAINRCRDCLEGVKTISFGGSSDLAPLIKKVLGRIIITDSYEISRMDLLRKLYPDMDALTLDRIMDTMIEAGAITMFRSGNKLCYRMSEKAVKMYVEMVKEKS